MLGVDVGGGCCGAAPSLTPARDGASCCAPLEGSKAPRGPRPLSRARSWPLLAPPPPTEDPGGAPMPGAEAPVSRRVRAAPYDAHLAAQMVARRLLCRHYYPEGGWGWTVTACALLVQLLVHGLQLGYVVLVRTAQKKFDVTPLQASGIVIVFV